MKTKLLILLGVFFAGVTFAQKPEIKQGPLAKGVKVTNLAMYIGEDENYYYFFDCSIKTTVLGFDKTDLSLKVEKEFKSKLTVRFPVYGGVYGETIELVTAKCEPEGYRLEKFTIKKTDMTLTSTEDIGFSPFSDGKRHVINMDPVELKNAITISTKCSPDQSHHALVRLDKCKNGAPDTWKIEMLDNTTGATLWSRDTNFHFNDYILTGDDKIILVGYYLADSEDKAIAALLVMSNNEEEQMSFALPVNIGSAELLLDGNRLFVTGSLKGDNYGKKLLFGRDVDLSGMYVTLIDLNEKAVVTSDEYPFTKEDVDVYLNVKEGKSRDNLVKWIGFHPYLMSDGRVCVKGEYAYSEIYNTPSRGSMNTHTGDYYQFGKKGCILNMFDADGNLLWRKPYRNELVGTTEVINDDVFNIQGNLCYYSLVCGKYKYSQTDVAASQDPRILQTKLREIILDQEGNETVNVIDGKGEFGIAAQGYDAARTKRVFLMIEQGMFKSDVRLMVVK